MDPLTKNLNIPVLPSSPHFPHSLIWEPTDPLLPHTQKPPSPCLLPAATRRKPLVRSGLLPASPLDYMVHEGLVQEGVVHEIGGPLEEVSSPIPHKILTMMHLIHSGRISGQRRSVSFPVQDGIRSSSSSGSSNYPTGQDPVYNPLHGNDNRVREPMDPLHHQAKYHHRSCMCMESMNLLHHHIQIYQICIH
jgi:hypothetical protein